MNNHLYFFVSRSLTVKPGLAFSQLNFVPLPEGEGTKAIDLSKRNQG